MSDTLIIIPTYNEKDNIEKLIREIFEHAPDVDIFIVDDASPDGTGVLADEIAKREKRVSVLRRRGLMGRGSADVEGFKEALRREDVLYAIVMDADLSHDPRYIPMFLKELKKSDLVIGSRYIEGGRDCERGRIRIILSKLVNLFIRKYFAINIRDCTSGYRAFRKEVLMSLGLDNMDAKEPSGIEEILYKSSLRRYKVNEIPIVFRKRYSGKSKLGIVQLFRVFMDILKLKRHAVSRTSGEDIKRELRKFGFNLALGLNILGCIMFHRQRPHFIWFTGIGSISLISAIIYPKILAPLKKVLDFGILLIGRAVNTVTLAIAFYLIFTPVGILLRLLGRDILHQKIDRSQKTYWLKIERTDFTPASYERMG